MRRKTGQALSLRARIVLSCAEGGQNTEVAAGPADRRQVAAANIERDIFQAQHENGVQGLLSHKVISIGFLKNPMLRILDSTPCQNRR